MSRLVFPFVLRFQGLWGVSEEHLYASVSGEALIAGRSPFPSLGPRVGVRIAPSGRGVDAAGEPRADLVGPTPLGQDHRESGSGWRPRPGSRTH